MGKDTRSPEERAAARQEKIDALHQTLTGAVEALVTGEDWQRAMSFAARFRRYSFGNVLLIAAASQAAYERGLMPAPYPQYVAGYRAWQSLGRQVRAGTRGFGILAPRVSRVAVAEDGSWRRLDKGEQPGPGETTASKMTGVVPTTVFPVEFTDGDPLPESPVPKLLEGEAPPGLWDGLASVVRDLGFTVDIVPSAAYIYGANGVTRWGTNEVLVRADMDPLAMCKTLAHEAAHATGHDRSDPDVPARRGLIEVEAESAALMVLSAHNVDTSQYTVPYVSTWASRVDGMTAVDAVQQTAGRVRTIALGILAKLDTHMVPDGDPPGLVRTAPQAKTPTKQAPEPSSGKAVVPDDGLARPVLAGRHHDRSLAPSLTDGARR